MLGKNEKYKHCDFYKRKGQTVADSETTGGKQGTSYKTLTQATWSPWAEEQTATICEVER